jgi:hypothetical protein
LEEKRRVDNVEGVVDQSEMSYMQCSWRQRSHGREREIFLEHRKLEMVLHERDIILFCGHFWRNRRNLHVALTFAFLGKNEEVEVIRKVLQPQTGFIVEPGEHAHVEAS